MKPDIPYFRIKNEPEHFLYARFLCRKFSPCLRKKFLQHYLVSPDHRIYLKFIQNYSKTHPYFLRFDIDKYFPSINHSILLEEINSVYSQLTQKPLSRRMRRFLKLELPQFLKLSPYPGQGLPLGNPLSHILAGIYLLKLDLRLPVPFLRFCDDYLLFCKSGTQPQKILREIIQPLLTSLSLSVNLKKSMAGKFHQDRVNFIGFYYYAGYIGVCEDKIGEFKQRIKEITYLRHRKPLPAIIKLLNNQVLGFGHYYKFAKAKQVFEELDSFLRSRLRRYLNRNKDSRCKQANLILTNQVLKDFKLKSLKEIYEKYRQKTGDKFLKKRKITPKIKHAWKPPNSFNSQHLLYLRQIALDSKIDELANLVKKLTTQIAKLMQKLQ